MTSPQDILALIEEVDPSNTARLDEIDARVTAFVRGGEAYTYTVGLENEYTVWGVRNKHMPGNTGFIEAHKIPAYTRSRDALKAIRPKGWSFYINIWPNELGKSRSYVWAENGKKQFRRSLATEELAELWTIIKAIQHDRGGKA